MGRPAVTFKGANEISVALKNRPYTKIYNDLLCARSFSVRMLDGALIQMMYMFDGNELEQHRLAYFHNPDLEPYQNDPEIYLVDQIYAEIASRHVSGFPFRFDFNARTGVHSKSHLTLGQYKNCRIPVTHPVRPTQFVDFLLRNFYDVRYLNQLPSALDEFDESIEPAARALTHVHML